MQSNWTQAVRGVHFLWFPIPAYSSVTVLFWVMHARVWTALLALFVVGVLTYLHMRGRSVPWVVRRIKSRMRGGVVLARPVWFRRRVQHLESFDLVKLRD
jgi:hypothetical protein